MRQKISEILSKIVILIFKKRQIIFKQYTVFYATLLSKKINLSTGDFQRLRLFGGMLFLFSVLYEPEASAETATYTVDFSQGHKKTYALTALGPEDPIKIIYINFREDREAIQYTLDGLITQVPQKTEVLVIIGDKANILGALLARAAHIPWIILTSHKPFAPVYQAINYRSITSGSKTLYMSSDQAQKIKGKQIIIFDDILSTGETIAAAVRLTEAVGAKISRLLVGFTEGVNRTSLVIDEKAYPILKVGHLPVFKK